MSVPAGYKVTEVGVIPVDWDVVPLGTVGPFSKGQGIRKDQASSGDIPCVRYGELYTDHNDVVRAYRSRISRDVASTSKLLRTGDLLFAGSGETKEEIGKCVAFVDDVEAYAGGDLIILSPRAADSVFLGYLLNADPIVRQKAARAQGDMVVHISARALAEVAIPLPPAVTEQAAIAAALSDVDEAIAAVKAVIAKKRALKIATMQALLSGTRRLPGFSDSTHSNEFKQTDVGKIPTDWEVIKLGDVGKPIIGLTYSPLDVRETGTLVLRSSNVQNGALSFENNVHVDPHVASKALVQQNDILICVRNGSRDLIGKCAKIDAQANGMAFGAFMSIFRSPENDFVFHQFQSDLMRRQINEHLGATINQITNGSLVGFKMPWPVNSAERAAISLTLSDFDDDIGHQECKLAKLLRLKTGMMQQLLTGKIRLT